MCLSPFSISQKEHLSIEEAWAQALMEGKPKGPRWRRRPPTRPYPNWGPLEAPLPDAAASEVSSEASSDATMDQDAPLGASRGPPSPKAPHADEAPWRSLPLEAFEALSEDEFLRGPGGPPLTVQEKRHLRHYGMDFKEKLKPRKRSRWGPLERERWQRSRRLRHLIKTKQV